MIRSVMVAIGLLLGLSATPSQAAIVYSISDTDALAGSDLSVVLGETDSMYVWVSTNPGQTYAGIGLDLLSSDATIVEALNYEIFNPGPPNRWLSVDTGTLGDLVTDSNAFALPGVPGLGTGISTSGVGDYVLFSEIEFTATALGTTDLSFAVNSNGIGDLDGLVDPGTIDFGTGSITAITAVPEPGSFAVLGLTGLAMAGRKLRRRRLAKPRNV